jgi:C4-type Zn-finger protein
MHNLECPFCGHEFKIDDYESDEFDETCPKCDKEFEVTVEYSPRFSEIKIEYVICDECGNELRTSQSMGHNTFPRPNKYKDKAKFYLCKKCWYKLYEKDMKEFRL